MRIARDSRYTGPALLALADGRVFRGSGFGARTTTKGELVFNTSLTGYQEIMSDPSYAAQLVCLTAVEIGNVGVNEEDEESRGQGAAGLLVRSLSPVVSNWRAQGSLHDYLCERGVPGMAEFDTRALTRHLRDKGSVAGVLSTEITDAETLVAMAQATDSLGRGDLAATVTTAVEYVWDEGSWDNEDPLPAATEIIAYDFGIKHTILRKLRDRGMRVTVVPASTPAKDVLARAPDGIFLSNGPGDPASMAGPISEIRQLIDGCDDIPVFGICLGHQILALALGGSTYKLKFGHHGGNHPVRDEADRSVAITAQNHGFAVDPRSIGERASVTHVNLFDGTVAGLEIEGRAIHGVQFHPEASPGPHDSATLFSRFADQVRDYRDARRGQIVDGPCP